jgi:hypothetical protein
MWTLLQKQSSNDNGTAVTEKPQIFLKHFKSTILFHQLQKLRLPGQVPVAYACNPSYLES